MALVVHLTENSFGGRKKQVESLRIPLLRQRRYFCGLQHHTCEVGEKPIKAYESRTSK